MTHPEHFISDLKALRERLLDQKVKLEDTIRQTKPEQAVRMAKLEGMWAMLSDNLGELSTMIGAWEKGWPAFQVTEELIAQEDHGADDDDDDEEIWGSYRGDRDREDFHSDG